MNSTDCLICFEEIKINNCCITECNHAFCLTCMIKASLNKKECPYWRDKLLKNEDNYEEKEDEEDEVEEVENNVIGDVEFSENEDDDSEYQPENNIRNSDTIIRLDRGSYTYSYMKRNLQKKAYKYLLGNGWNIEIINKFKNCNFNVFYIISPDLCLIPSSNNSYNDIKKYYDLFLKDSNNLYSYAKKEYKRVKKIKNKEKVEKDFLKKAIDRIKSISIKVKKNKSKKNNKEKINKNRSFKF